MDPELWLSLSLIALIQVRDAIEQFRQQGVNLDNVDVRAPGATQESPSE
jgi:hypothetical protein